MVIRLCIALLLMAKILFASFYWTKERITNSRTKRERLHSMKLGLITKQLLFNSSKHGPPNLVTPPPRLLGTPSLLHQRARLGLARPPRELQRRQPQARRPLYPRRPRTSRSRLRRSTSQTLTRSSNYLKKLHGIQ